MVQNPPEGHQRIIPYLLYADAPAACDFLCTAFGFTERFRFEMGEGQLGHAELAMGDSVVMLATAPPDTGFASPKDLPGQSAFVTCYVDDVDTHREAAIAAGAEVEEAVAHQSPGPLLDIGNRGRQPEIERGLVKRGALERCFALRLFLRAGRDLSDQDRRLLSLRAGNAVHFQGLWFVLPGCFSPGWIDRAGCTCHARLVASS